MAIVIKPITVEVSKPNVFQAIAAKQNDSNSRFLKVTFVNEGEKIYVMPSSKVTINAERNDGQSDSFFGVVNDDGTATVPIHSWILELPGYVDCDVSIIEENSKLTSTTFTLLVEEASHGDDDVSQDPQTNVLGDLIKEVEALETGMNNVFASAIPNTSSGSVVSLTDISQLEHILRVKARSENILPFPYPFSSQTLNGINIIVNNDGTMSTDGIPTKATSLAFANNLVLKKGQYFFKALQNDAVIPNNIYYAYVQVGANYYYDNGLGVAFPVTEPTSVAIRLIIGMGYDGTATTFKPMLSTTKAKYKPFVDVSTSNIQRHRKNVIPYPFYSSSTTRDGVTFTDNGDGSISIKGKPSKDIYYTLMYQTAYLGDDYINAINAEEATNSEFSANKRLYYDSEKHDLYIILLSGVEVDETLFPQVEKGVKITEYEPPVAVVTYPINTDGTVEGVTSLYPTTTLKSDTDGVVLDVEYNADTKKYIDNKFAVLAAMIVNS